MPILALGHLFFTICCLLFAIYRLLFAVCCLPFAVCRLLFAGTRCDPQQAYPIVSGIHLASARPLRVLSKSANWCNKVFTRMRYALTPATHRH